MSPTDPIFFLHHANIDRLWDVWTRKQLKQGGDILPDGYRVQPAPPRSAYAAWSQEPFLFFVDAEGHPIDKTNAGDYADIGDFNYKYEPGTGEKVVEQVVGPTALAAPGGLRSFSARLAPEADGESGATLAVVEIPASLLQQASGPEARTLFATVTIDHPPGNPTRDLWVFIDDVTNAATPANPSFVGTLSMFGHHMSNSPFTFTVPLRAPLTAMRASNALAMDQPLKLRVVPAQKREPHIAMAHEVGAALPSIVSIEVEAP